MSLNAFINRPKSPTGSELAAALTTAKTAWDQFLAELAQEFDVHIHEWKSHSPKAGWSLRVKRKARTVVWLSPFSGYFQVTFILGEKAIKAASLVKFPQRIIKALHEAPKYPEGTGLRLNVRSVRDIGALKKLAAIKLAN